MNIKKNWAKLLLINLFFCVSAYSADWTPSFRYLESGKKGDEGKILDALRTSIFLNESEDKNGDFKKDILTPNAKKGSYNVPEHYQNDTLPAKLLVINKKQAHAFIPLKNAYLYGYKLKGFHSVLNCSACGDVYFYATFEHMSTEEYNKLKQRVLFKKYALDEDNVCGIENSAQFYQDKGEVELILNIAC